MTPAPTTGNTITLSAIADDAGTFAIVAMDQRNTLRRMFASQGIEPTDADMRQAKIDVAAALSPSASGILLDPDFGVPAVRDAGVLADSCGLLVAAEPAERGNYNGEPRPHRLPEQGAQWVRDMGGQAVKFLVQMNPLRTVKPGEPDLAAETVEVVRAVVEDCRAVGIPSVIENLIYQIPGNDPMSDAERADAIITSAEMLTAVQPDILKLEYPGSADACRRLSNVLTVPWAVLSAGVDFEIFTDVLRVSCDDGGASGFIAGRAVWKEAIGMDEAQRAEFFANVAVPRLDACRAAIAGRARPWVDV
jgi:tagatose-1,6-bisphosphate aldolase